MLFADQGAPPRCRNWKGIDHMSAPIIRPPAKRSEAAGGRRSTRLGDRCGSCVHRGPGVGDGRLRRCQHVHGSRASVPVGRNWSPEVRDSYEGRDCPREGQGHQEKVSFTYQTVTPMMRCGTSTACDTAYQQLTIPPGGYTGWHTHPGPTFVAVAQGEGTLYHGMSGCPSVKYGAGRASCSPPPRCTT